MSVVIVTMRAMAALVQCGICGQPTVSKYGVCRRTQACELEYSRRKYAADPAARLQRQRAYREANREAIAERERARSRRRYLKDPVAAQEKQQLWRIRHQEAVRESRRQYLQRTDRPCRYAKAGCPDLAIAGGTYCRQHTRLDNAQRNARRRAQLKQKLIRRDGPLCSWCLLPLPEDLTQTDLDHIIPKVVAIIENEWNLRVLHVKCNRSKYDTITDLARELAAAHGISLTDVGQIPIERLSSSSVDPSRSCA